MDKFWFTYNTWQFMGGFRQLLIFQQRFTVFLGEISPKDTHLLITSPPGNRLLPTHGLCGSFTGQFWTVIKVCTCVYIFQGENVLPQHIFHHIYSFWKQKHFENGSILIYSNTWTVWITSWVILKVFKVVTDTYSYGLVRDLFVPCICCHFLLVEAFRRSLSTLVD